MGLTFVKKKAATAPDEGTAAGPAPATKLTVVPKTTHLGWLKSGAAAKQAMAHEEAKAEERKAEYGKMWRFFMKSGDDTQITFLDGGLDDEGNIDCVVFNEHLITVDGEKRHFVCTANTNDEQQYDENAPPCPICEKGDKPSFVGLLTILDHTAHKIKNGPNAGKIISNTRKLFVAKRTTLKYLAKLAAKHGNKLAGCTYDVSRSDDKKPAVGDLFDFVAQYPALSAVAEKYGLTLEDVQPAKYEDEITFRTNAQLIEIGVGKAQVGPGYEKKNLKGLKDEL
jgi:hypothetical protein